MISNLKEGMDLDNVIWQQIAVLFTNQRYI